MPTQIHRNAGRGGSPPEPIEKLIARLETIPLDWRSAPFIERETSSATTFSGDFLGISAAFQVTTDDPELTTRLTSLIEANVQTPGYQEQLPKLDPPRGETFEEARARYITASHAVDEARNALDSREDRLKRLIAWHQECLEELVKSRHALYEAFPHWSDTLVGGIANDLRRDHFPTYVFEVGTPMGIGATTSIWVYDSLERRRYVAFLSFRPKDLRQGELEMVDYSRRTREVPPGSIAELNGLQYATGPLPSINEIAETIRRQARENGISV